MVPSIYMMEHPFSFEDKIKKSLESKQPMKIEIIDEPILIMNGHAKSPNARMQEIINDKESQEVVYMRRQQISEVNDSPKFTTNVRDCTVLVVIGRDRITGKQISFMSHSKDPINFNIVGNYWATLPQDEREKIKMGFNTFIHAENPKDNIARYEKYEHLLTNAMNEVRIRCDTDTIDAIIAGGQILEKIGNAGVVKNIPKDEIEKAKEGYERSVGSLKAITASILGIDAHVAHQPRSFIHDTQYPNGITTVIDTQNRKLYVRIVY